MSDSPMSAMRNVFDSGVTRSYSFRVEQLRKLKKAILDNEKEIEKALYTDLKKSVAETYATETGLLLAEINTTLKNLHAWMEPKQVSTNLVNFPSTSKIYRDPLGVVLIIAPWNYPLQLLLIPLVGAIAGGNCAVIKPSEYSVATAKIIQKIISSIFTDDYIKVVTGEGGEVVPQLMNSFRFDHIMYTGSVVVGRAIYQMAAKDLIPVTLELGGKSPAIIEPGANLEVSAKRVALGKFINVGQTCVAPDYVLVHKSIKEKFVSLLKEKIQKFYGDDPSGSYDYGKIINEKRFDKLLEYLKDGKVIFGGTHDKSKLYIAPTVLDEVNVNARVMTEEIFGPILPILSYETFEEAVQIVKKNPNPLAFYLFTSSAASEEKWINRVSFGGGCINNAAWQFANHHLPFGGVGLSGTGSIHGKYSFDTFTREKSVLETPTWFDPALKYPSFKNRLGLFKKLIR
ncbi:MAG: aldehyde dehydrogenase family protein [Bacteroidetes bacterium]|nr:MAG: aldehyde dehydrogenase family protein [Bacteroidota bacterium]